MSTSVVYLIQHCNFSKCGGSLNKSQGSTFNGMKVLFMKKNVHATTE
jgi:hypothetical protein